MHFSLPKGLKQNKGGSEIYKTNGALWLSWDESSECLNYTHLQTQKSKLARMFFFSFIVIFLLLWLYFHINFLSILNLSWSMIMVYESNIFSIWPSHHLLKYLSFLHCIRVGLKYYNKEVLKYYWNQIEIISLAYT